jgi:threonine/homoserine/homoserine lactone efflux protein
VVVAVLIGFAFGFLGSVPVGGPVAVLVFARGIQGRFRSAVNLAVGASISEAAYAFLAFWGFSAFLVQHAWIEPVSRGVATLILLALGYHFAFGKASSERPTVGGPEAAAGWSFLLGFSISALNPVLITTWGAAVAMLHSVSAEAVLPGNALPFALGAGAGIAGWFVLFSLILRRYRRRFRLETLHRALRITGWLVLGLGGFFAVRFVLYWV